MTISDHLSHLNSLVQEQLAPQAQRIDRESFYPREFMHTFGTQKGFAAHCEQGYGGLGYGIAAQIRATAEIGRVCGSTAFSTWCQTACAWYIQNSANEALKARYLESVLTGHTLAGTGLSNTVKSLAGIERHNLSAVPEGDGFRINGKLPWVTNIGKGHVFAATAELEGGKLVMFLIECDQQGVSLDDAIRFCALNGTQTLSASCDNVLIEAHQVLASPEVFEGYLARIKSGFVLLQLGMALGALYSVRDLIERSNQFIAELNSLLDYGIDDLDKSIAHIENQMETLGASSLNPEHFLAVLKLRLYASKAVLAGSQAACLHCGAHGYLENHPAQRLAREAMFVAIITPSVKHLKKEIKRLEAA